MSRGISTRAGGAAAIVVAAGEGTRLGARVPKALVPLAGRALVEWSVEALDRSPEVVAVVIVAPKDHLGPFVDIAARLNTPCRAVAGGPSRAESVANGLDVLDAQFRYVMVHDAARPLLTPAMVHACLDGIGDASGCMLAAPVADSLKRVSGGVIEASVPREGLWGAQTPQAFPSDVLVDAVARGRADGTLPDATDCSSLVEKWGGRVRVVDPGGPNMKVTTPADLTVAEFLLRARSSTPTVG